MTKSRTTLLTFERMERLSMARIAEMLNGGMVGAGCSATVEFGDHGLVAVAPDSSNASRAREVARQFGIASTSAQESASGDTHFIDLVTGLE